MPGERKDFANLEKDLVNAQRKMREAEQSALRILGQKNHGRQQGETVLQPTQNPTRGRESRLSDDEKKREAQRRNRWAREAKRSREAARQPQRQQEVTPQMANQTEQSRQNEPMVLVNGRWLYLPTREETEHILLELAKKLTI